MADYDPLVVLPALLPLIGVPLTLAIAPRRRLQSVVALAVLAAALGAGLVLLRQVLHGNAAAVVQLGGWPAPFGVTLIADPLSALLVVMSLGVLLAGFVYALGSGDACVRAGAFAPLFLAIAAGLCGAFLTGDLFSLFVFAELVVIAGTVLTSLSDDSAGAEAALKYFYMSLLASTFLLLACGAMYVAYGTLNMADLAARIAAHPGAPAAALGLAFLIAAFMIKSAVVPFHFWQPDFHSAAPTAVSAMLSSVVVKLGVYGLIRVTTLLFLPQAGSVRALLVSLGVAGILYGGLAAAGTHNAKRMLAYSTLAQVGFILVAVGWGTAGALLAALVFTVNHSLIKAALFMLSGALVSRAPVKSADFAVLEGVGRTTPAIGAMFLVAGLALAGVPPTAGFVSKLVLFQSGIGASRYAALGVVALLSALTLVYVARSYLRLFREPAADGRRAKPRGDSLLAPTVLVVAVILFGLWPGPLFAAAASAAEWLLEPGAYVRAVLGG